MPRGGETPPPSVGLFQGALHQHYKRLHVFCGWQGRLKYTLAEEIVMNPRSRRPGVFNAAETLLVDNISRISFLLRPLVKSFLESVELVRMTVARLFTSN